MIQPAKAVHWDGARDEEVILQIIGYGPSGTSQANPQEPFSIQSNKEDLRWLLIWR